MTTSGAAPPILTPQTIKAEGVTTAYLQGGFAEPVLMPHSSGTDVSATANWQHTIPVLAEKFHVQTPTSSGSWHRNSSRYRQTPCVPGPR